MRAFLFLEVAEADNLLWFNNSMVWWVRNLQAGRNVQMAWMSDSS